MPPEIKVIDSRIELPTVLVANFEYFGLLIAINENTVIPVKLVELSFTTLAF